MAIDNSTWGGFLDFKLEPEVLGWKWGGRNDTRIPVSIDCQFKNINNLQVHTKSSLQALQATCHLCSLQFKVFPHAHSNSGGAACPGTNKLY